MRMRKCYSIRFFAHERGKILVRVDGNDSDARFKRRWLTLGSVILGLVETFLYGAYAGLAFTGIHNLVLRRCG